MNDAPSTLAPETFAAMASDPAVFRRSLMIDADGQTVPFRPDPWQEADFVAMDPAWKLAAGRGDGEQAPIRRAWLERPRGHAKTSDLAVPISWASLFAERPISGI